MLVLAVVLGAVALGLATPNANAYVRSRYHYNYLTPGASDHTDFDTPISAYGDFGWCTAIYWNEMYMQYTYYDGTVALIKTNGSWARSMTDDGGHVVTYETNYQSYRKKAYCANPSIATWWANCYYEYHRSGNSGCPIPV